MRKLKPALPICLAVDLLLAACIVAACGVRSPLDGVAESDASTSESGESTEETGDSTECVTGAHNYMDGDWCKCDPGYTWCDGITLDCCEG